MDEIDKFRIFNKLKSVYRLNTVDNRKESSAEHSWSCLMLADFFLSQMDLDIDKVRVYELLMYHDVVEIETGDTPLEPGADRENKDRDEREAVEMLKEVLPENMDKKFVSLFKEYKERKTLEAKFAKAIDVLDPTIHELDHKEDWKGWSREFLIEKKSKYFKDFPLMEETFYKLLDYMEENGYFGST